MAGRSCCGKGMEAMKKIVIFSVLLALLCCGCGDQPTVPAPTAAPTLAVTPVPTPLPTPEPTPEPTRPVSNSDI